MAQDKLEDMVQKTIAYMDSPEGKRQWKENQLAHGFIYPKNMVAAIQTANWRRRCVRYEDLQEVMAQVEERRKGRAA